MPFIRVDGIDIEVVYKKIKYMHLYVLPPDGSVRITAPRHAGSEAIAGFAASKLAWIRQKQFQMTNRPVQPALQYLTGEQHSLWGTKYPLAVAESPKPGVVFRYDTIYLYAPNQSTAGQRGAILDRWYRKQMQGMLPGLFAKWEGVIGVRANEVRIRNMRTRWGTCNVDKKRIWINLQLVKKPVECLEYVVVHELVHLIEKSHSAVFKMHMSRLLPGWVSVKKKMNSLE